MAGSSSVSQIMRANAVALEALVVAGEAQRAELARGIRELGFQPVLVESYSAALSQLNWKTVLAVVDANLEQGRGARLAELFRQRRPRLPIVLVAGTFADGERLRCATLGVGGGHEQLRTALSKAQRLARISGIERKPGT